MQKTKRLLWPCLFCLAVHCNENGLIELVFELVFGESSWEKVSIEIEHLNSNQSDSFNKITEILIKISKHVNENKVSIFTYK